MKTYSRLVWLPLLLFLGNSCVARGSRLGAGGLATDQSAPAAHSDPEVTITAEGDEEAPPSVFVPTTTTTSNQKGLLNLTWTEVAAGGGSLGLLFMVLWWMDRNNRRRARFNKALLKLVRETIFRHTISFTAGKKT